MNFSRTVSLEVCSLLDAAVVRAVAKHFADFLQFPSLASGQVAICAGELATNIVKHAKKGCIIMSHDSEGLLLCAQDSGQGIEDISLAVLDGFSGVGFLRGDEQNRRGLGCGLGAILRLMDRVEFLRSEQGFCVRTWKWKRA
jgi:anti-sigma regulatory factor (Ser/Thr protein kinase)